MRGAPRGGSRGVDTPCPRRDAHRLRRSRALGFACTACIHPAQVPVVNEEYGVSPADADRARRLLAAFEQALAEGKGAVAFEGTMVDLPVAERARALLARVRPG